MRPMKRLGRVLLAGLVVLVAVVLVALVTIRITGLDPRERRPGLWLRGEAEATPVADWAFTDAHPNIYVETRTWYLVPHSVTVTCTALGGRLYLTSVFPAGARFPQDKAWTRDVARDPRVRLKIGNRVFDRRLVLVTDAAERDAALGAKARKYPKLRVPATSAVYVFRVEPA